MKEITRIHIARTSYDIEIEAKKELEAYLKALEAYSDDADIMNDIEIRITEILADRGVAKGEVVTHADAEALKQQLGEPKDFMSEDDMVAEPVDEEQSNGAGRKLFRDTDRAVAGGVLAGIAAFFKVNPAIVRVIFIIIALASFGTALLVYIVLWVAVPPARTAADKLQMIGRPVTISSIRQLNEAEAFARPNSGQARRVIFAVLGILCSFAALGAALLTFFITVVALRPHENLVRFGDETGLFIAAFILAVVSGVLLTTLCILGAYASFTMRATKRVLIGMSVVTVVGLASFGTALGLAQYGALQYRDTVKANTHETERSLPASPIKNLAADASSVEVNYVVSTGTPRAVIRTMSGEGVQPDDVRFTMEGDTLKLSATTPKTTRCELFWCSDASVTIYGPALESISGNDKTDIDYAGGRQDNLRVEVQDRSEVVLSRGTFGTLTATAGSGTELSTGNATVSAAVVSVEHNADIELGVVAELSITSPMACPEGGVAHIEVTDVTSGKTMLNGQTTTNGNTKGTPCLQISIENEGEDRD
jgi:phage shock protein PspC (stress-responsive transcriptional regulator)